MLPHSRHCGQPTASFHNQITNNNPTNRQMSFVQVLSKIFGNKSQRDLKAIRPIVDKIKAIGPSLENLSNDELRSRIDAVRADL
ncbi:MAG: hypothetical protein K2K00_07560, partial [Muribaculaceae bacterium]|nr:hypothetical protein [Muribaculaceae bacterium]